VWLNVGERDHLQDPGVDGRIVLIWIFRKWNGWGQGWIDLAQNRDMWRALVNAVSIKCGHFLTRCEPVILSKRTLFWEVSEWVTPRLLCWYLYVFVF
jgi:hypothetical protein